MGQCLKVPNSKYDKTTLSHQKITEILEDQREKLISEIHYLHSLTISCKLGVNICAEGNNMRIAILIMLKQIYVASRMMSVQFLIKQNDDSVYSSEVQLMRKLQIATQITILIDKKRQILDGDNIADFLDSNPEFLLALNVEVESKNLDKLEAEKQVRKIFQEKKNYPSNVNRRKYVKSKGKDLKC